MASDDDDQPSSASASEDLSSILRADDTSIRKAFVAAFVCLRCDRSLSKRFVA